MDSQSVSPSKFRLTSSSPSRLFHFIKFSNPRGAHHATIRWHIALESWTKRSFIAHSKNHVNRVAWSQILSLGCICAHPNKNIQTRTHNTDYSATQALPPIMKFGWGKWNCVKSFLFMDPTSELTNWESNHKHLALQPNDLIIRPTMLQEFL